MTRAPGRPSAGDIIGRIVFGGFWSAVTLGVTVFAFVSFSDGNGGPGLIGLIVAVLTGLYSAYIFRGGRFRFLFF